MIAKLHNQINKLLKDCRSHTMFLSLTAIIFLLIILFCIDGLGTYLGKYLLVLLGFSLFLLYSNYLKIKELEEKLEVTTFDLNNTQKSLVASYNLLREKDEVIKSKLYLDSTTGLPNERTLLNTVGILNNDTIIIQINICHFREINCIYNYSVGDEILKQLGERISNHKFASYKSNNDEFTILLKNQATIAEIDTLANYLFSILSNEPYKIHDIELFLTVSIGVSVYKYNENEVKTLVSLIDDASFALKYAKEHNLQYALYDFNLVTKLKEQYNYTWKENIIHALKNDGICVFYQPIINNKTKMVEKYEALMRIKDREGNFISPHRFMSSSIKYGLYNDLTRRVIINVVNQIKHITSDISINISISDIRNVTTMRLINKSIKSLPKNKASNLIFELLESEGIENYEEVNLFIKNVRSYGCKVAIDDFGSGYSNFNHLLNLEIDYIKIDSSIVQNIVLDKKSESIARLIVEFSKTINAKTVAEFVDSETIYQKVKSLGIDYSQGYYFSKPLEDISEYLSKVNL